MLHKIVEIRKTDYKYNNLLKYSCYACYQDYSFSSFAKLDMLITSISIITIGTGMLGTIFKIEIIRFKKTSVFIERSWDNAYIVSLVVFIIVAVINS